MDLLQYFCAFTARDFRSLCRLTAGRIIARMVIRKNGAGETALDDASESAQPSGRTA